MRSKLPVEGGGIGLAANRDGSGKGGFCFGDGCVGIEERIDAGQLENAFDAGIHSYEGEAAFRLLAMHVGADERADGHRIYQWYFGEVDDHPRVADGEDCFHQCGRRFVGDRPFQMENLQAFGGARLFDYAKWFVGHGAHSMLVRGWAVKEILSGLCCCVLC